MTLPQCYYTLLKTDYSKFENGQKQGKQIFFLDNEKCRFIEFEKSIEYEKLAKINDAFSGK